VRGRSTWSAGVVVLGLLLSAGGAEPNPAPSGWRTDMKRAWQTAQQSRRPLLLYFKMANCVYCRKMERETLADEALANDIQTRFVSANLTLEQDADLVRQYQVRTFPTMVIVSPGGKVIDHISGYVAAKDLRTRLRLAADKQTTLKR
jgi:thioredoxin-related protein